MIHVFCMVCACVSQVDLESFSHGGLVILNNTLWCKAILVSQACVMYRQFLRSSITLVQELDIWHKLGGHKGWFISYRSCNQIFLVFEKRFA